VCELADRCIRPTRTRRLRTQPARCLPHPNATVNHRARSARVHVAGPGSPANSLPARRSMVISTGVVDHPSGRPLRRPADPDVHPAQSSLQSTKERTSRAVNGDATPRVILPTMRPRAIGQSGARADRTRPSRITSRPARAPQPCRCAARVRSAVHSPPRSCSRSSRRTGCAAPRPTRCTNTCRRRAAALDCPRCVDALTRILRVDAPSRDSSRRMVPSTTARMSPSTAAKAWERAVRQRVRCRPRLASVDDERSGVARVGVLDDHLREPIDVQLREL
jgi:hypothetical protein